MINIILHAAISSEKGRFRGTFQTTTHWSSSFTSRPLIGVRPLPHDHSLEFVLYLTTTHWSSSFTSRPLIGVRPLPHDHSLEFVLYLTTTHWSSSFTSRPLIGVRHLPQTTCNQKPYSLILSYTENPLTHTLTNNVDQVKMLFNE